MSELLKNKSEGTQVAVKTVKSKAKKEVGGGKQKSVIHMMVISKKAKRATEGSRQKETSTGRQTGHKSKTLKVLGRTIREEGRRKSKKIENNQVKSLKTLKRREKT